MSERVDSRYGHYSIAVGLGDKSDSIIFTVRDNRKLEMVVGAILDEQVAERLYNDIGVLLDVQKAMREAKEK
jgi:hypothetical protein